jgi:hypothetical protein
MMRENLLRVHYAVGRMNGGNVHKGTAILRSYQNALELVNDPRNRKAQADARRMVFAAEAELREFAYGGA